MKAEKRHQLQRNALADGVGRLVQSVRSGPTTRSTMIWVFVILTLAAVVLWQYGAHATQVRYSQLWTAVDNASRDPNTGPSKLLQIGDQNSGTIPGRSALFQVARIEMENGQALIRTRFRQTDAAKQINESRKLYKKLAGECADASLLVQEAMMGIAQAEESLVGIPGSVLGPEYADEVFDLKRALKSYHELARLYPDSFLGEQAAKRAAEIEKDEPAIEKFYAEVNNWAHSIKDHLPEPDMGIPPPSPLLPNPIPLPGSSGSGPDLPPLTPPKTDHKTPATKPDLKEPPSKTDPKNNAKAAPAKKPDGKDSKSK